MSDPATDTVEELVPGQLPSNQLGVSVAELFSSFYVWLLVWLVGFATVPALLFGYEPIIIVSGSMGPVISPGDVILLDEAPSGFVETGTVITFAHPEDPEVLVTHRVDGIREDGLYRTRGDANGEPDSTPVAPEEVVGVGRMLVPLVGLPVLWLQSDLLKFLLFVVLTAAAVLAAIVSHRLGQRAADAPLHVGREAPT